MPAEHRSYSTIEVAKQLGVSLQTVQRWVDAGHLRAWKTLGGHRRIDAASAEELFKSRSGASGASADSAETPAASTRPLRVLLVDDAPIDLQLMGLLVRRALPEALIDLAADGFQALISVGLAVPDILITDIHMPHMDGFEMIRSLSTVCAVRPGIIIAVSSLSPSDLAAHARALPAVQFMSKPIDEGRLAETLRRARIESGEIAGH